MGEGIHRCLRVADAHLVEKRYGLLARRAFGQAFREMWTRGMPPSHLADRVFEGIENGRFYIVVDNTTRGAFYVLRGTFLAPFFALYTMNKVAFVLERISLHCDPCPG